MERVISYTITGCGSGTDIHSFLRSRGYSRHILASMKPDPQAVLVNGKHQFMRYVLHEGDLLTVRVEDRESSENVIPAPVPFSIAYEDEDILVIDKPAGESIHPAVGHPADTLANGIAWYYRQQGVPFVVRCINRLDRDTSGLLVVAKNPVSACVLERDLRTHQIHRTYLAVAAGKLPPDGTISLPVARKEGSLIERCVDMENGAPAVTHFRRLDYFEKRGWSLASLCLETGRTHQIRVHMAYTGHPLIGDTLYNPDFLRKPEDPVPAGIVIDRQALHSWKLDFMHPVTGEPLHFEAPIPADIRKLVSSNRHSW